MAKSCNGLFSTTVTDNPDEVAAWVLKTEAITRGRLGEFAAGLIYHRFDRLVVCFGPHCLVYKLPNDPPLPEPLVRFLDSSCHTFVGPKVESDLEVFGRHYDIHPYDMAAMDLGPLAALLYQRDELKGASMKQLAVLVLDKTVELRTDIFKRTLDKGQEAEIRKKLSKAMDAMMELEKEIDDLLQNFNLNGRLMSAKVEHDFTQERDDIKKQYDEWRKKRLDEFMAGFNTISLKLKEM
ncbi:hypothetical protein ACJIZ3_003418 [Penstemon smallii]|uniref:Uncharacterized protein n=1 Tax=Penstemon smallii TaxID=265156 RepID=A0ABD3UAM3_9LAMI